MCARVCARWFQHGGSNLDEISLFRNVTLVVTGLQHTQTRTHAHAHPRLYYYRGEDPPPIDPIPSHLQCSNLTQTDFPVIFGWFHFFLLLQHNWIWLFWALKVGKCKGDIKIMKYQIIFLTSLWKRKMSLRWQGDEKTLIVPVESEMITIIPDLQLALRVSTISL